MVDLKIENVMASLEFEMELDLQKIADSIDSAEYNPDQFPGLIYKLKSPKTVTLIFSKGHSVCTGATSLQNARAVLGIIFKKLNNLELISIDKLPKITIQNIVVSYKYKKSLNLEMISKKLPKTDSVVEFDKKKFPGIIYFDKATEIRVLMFRTGVIVGYGNPLLFEVDQLLTELEQYYT